MASTQPNLTNLMDILRDALQSGDYSDLAFRCKDKEWKVHKLIVCKQLQPIAAALDGNFPESKNGIYEFSESEPEDIEKMIKFMYTGDYSPVFDDTTFPPPGPLMLNAVKMYIIGDIYQISSLKELAGKNFKVCLSKMMDHRALGISLSLLYSQTRQEDRDLKDAAVSSLAHSGLKMNIMLECDEIRKAVEENGRLGLDLIVEMRRVANEEREAHLEGLRRSSMF